MKKTTKILSLLLTLFGLALVTGCTPITDTPDVPKETTYTVTIASGITNGTVSTNKTSAKTGETVKLTVTPNDGYEIDTLSVKNGDTEITVTNNQFTMPAGNVTVSASFVIKPYTVIFKDGDTVVSTQPIEHGKKAIKPTDPADYTKDNIEYEFAGWYTEDNKAFNPDNVITDSLTFYARWTEFRNYTVSYWYDGTQLTGDFSEINNILQITANGLRSETKTLGEWEKYFKEKLPIIYQDDNNSWSINQPAGTENTDWWSYIIDSLEITDTKIKLNLI